MSVPEHIKFLILKWKKKQLNEVEQKELDDWYDQPLPENLEIDGDEQNTKLKMFNSIQYTLGIREKRSFFLNPLWAGVAAAILIVAGISLYFINNKQTKENMATVHQVESNGSTKRIILPDSSIVWLKKNSKLSFPEDFAKNEREVVLNGEAFFEIAHNKRWPFKIKSGSFTTTVLGTSFNLRSGTGNNEYDIDVLTGKVEVSNNRQDGRNEIYFVQANQSFKALVGKVEQFKEEGKGDKIKTLTSGTQYDMAFDKVPFEEIMLRFEQKFNIKFEGYTGEYNACVITADLTNLSLNKSLQILCSAINANYKIDDNKIKLTGGGCF
ncbi:DUF4974 domain-containing protein [Pedobacter petrophilus]|uniref:DUF4974 domain-containing protein n=1 Tax=Pedobacter petrophilus TaxID=1908241 RepID=A0A7K0FVY4_9SPHI|nr:FecR family protein [Pedobacter petrophilus]MRX75753.1 DUF4974 domain-containing protein [Pedobacter petrophilus]